MTLHKLSAGSGYEYLTRQVAALDSTEMGRTSLADYYSAKGESPGRWVGSGLVGLDGLTDGDVVTAEQMKHLFGTGSHPLTGEALGKAYQVFDNSAVDEFNAEVGRRVVSTSSTSYEGRPIGEPLSPGLAPRSPVSGSSGTTGVARTATVNSRTRCGATPDRGKPRSPGTT